MRTRTATPLLVVLLSLATACSGSSDKPTVLPSLSPTPVATSSPAPIPAAAQGETSQALDAFVRFYFDQLNAAYSSADATLIRRYSDPICQTCNNYAQSLEKQPNQLVEGPSFAVTDVAAPPVNPAGTIVEVGGTTPARRLVRRDGSLVEAIPAGGRFHFQVNVIRVRTGWLVRGIRLAKT